MKFSVLMSLYFKESPVKLDKCFKSLFFQKKLPNEIILVIDGGITNELEEIISVWKSKLPLKIIRLEKNVGLGNALNIGMQHCQYEYIARMDTDDECYIERFEEQFKILESNPNIVLLGTQIEEYDDINNTIRKKILPLDKDEIKKYSLIKNPFNHMTVIFKKDIINKVGGYKHHLYMEDYNLWLRVIQSDYDVQNINKILLRASVNLETMKKRKGLKYIKSEIQLRKLKIELGIDKGLPSFIRMSIRIIMRLLPGKILEKIYSIDRKQKK